MPRVIVTAVGRPAEALAWRSADDSPRLKSSAQQQIEVFRCDVAHVARVRDTRWTLSIVIIGRNCVGAEVKRRRDFKAGFFESEIKASCTAKQAKQPIFASS